jgi:hypothetical protein
MAIWFTVHSCKSNLNFLHSPNHLIWHANTKPVTVVAYNTDSFFLPLFQILLKIIVWAPFFCLLSMCPCPFLICWHNIDDTKCMSLAREPGCAYHYFFSSLISSLVTHLTELSQLLKFFVIVRLTLQPAGQPICQDVCDKTSLSIK